jgi:hypothetical protein
MGLLELNRKLDRLEEQVLTWGAFNTYISDKNGFDITQILEMLFTVDSNVAIIEENLTDPNDKVVLARIVAKWKKTKEDAMLEAAKSSDVLANLILPSGYKH